MQKPVVLVLVLFLVAGPASAQSPVRTPAVPGAAPSLADQGTLIVEGEPRDLVVRVDGVRVGGPYEPHRVAAGERLVEVESEGYYPEAFTVLVETGRTLRLEVALVPFTGAVRIVGLPPGAVVRIEGQEVGVRTPIKTGEVEVVVRETGRRAARINVYVPGEQEIDLVYRDRVFYPSHAAGLLVAPGPALLLDGEIAAGAAATVGAGVALGLGFLANAREAREARAVRDAASRYGQAQTEATAVAAREEWDRAVERAQGARTARNVLWATAAAVHLAGVGYGLGRIVWRPALSPGPRRALQPFAEPDALGLRLRF